MILSPYDLEFLSTAKTSCLPETQLADFVLKHS